MTGLTRALRLLQLNLAVGLFAASTLGTFDPVADEGSLRTYGSLWETATDPAGGPAVLGIILLAAGGVVAVASVALEGRAGRAPAVALAVIGVLGMVMLLSKVGTTDPKPDLGPGGSMMLLLAVLVVLASIADLVTYRPAQRTQRAA